MSFFLRYKWHFLFWAVYFAFWTSISLNSYPTPVFLALLITLGWAISQGSLAYFCIYRLIPLYFNTRRYGIFCRILAAVLLVSALFILGYQLLLFGLAHRPMPYSIGPAFLYFL